jgi:hypothetical protein
MPFAALEDDFHSHPKVIAAGLDGAGLFARALSYCACHLTDGHVPGPWVKEIAGTKIARKVTAAGLWQETDGGYLIPDYNEFNPTREYVEKQRSELSEKRAAAGRKGAQKRWQRDSNADGKHDGNEMANACPPTPTPLGRGRSTRSVAPGPLAPVAPVPGYDDLHPELRATYSKARLEHYLRDPDTTVQDGRIYVAGRRLVIPSDHA